MALSRLDTGLVLAAILGCCAASAAVAWQARRGDGFYKVGDAFKEVSPTAGQSRPTLVIWLSTTCGHCETSMDFYERLSAGSRNARLVVLGFEPLETLEAYSRKFNLLPDATISTAGGNIRVPGTPTVVLLSKDGLVERIWIGKLDSRREKEVVASVD